MQVWLPAASKANTLESGADVKESSFIQMPVTWKLGALLSQSLS